MSSGNWSRVAICAVALTLCNVASAQWTATFDKANYNDYAVACCTDGQGNVFTIGTVDTDSSHGLDLVCRSYDSTGAFRWSFEYDGPDSKDDYGTAVSCDLAGNVYCAGISQNGDLHGQFIVVRLNNSNGNTVWPSSGDRGSGIGTYSFHNGVLRMTNGVDGTDPGSKEVCGLSVEQYDNGTSQPPIAITGPVNGDGTWRTTVFVYDGTDGIKIKTGWPYDDFGLSSEDSPHAVAISPLDDTVYVTGSAHEEASQFFTTVRYRSFRAGASA